MKPYPMQKRARIDRHQRPTVSSDHLIRTLISASGGRNGKSRLGPRETSPVALLSTLADRLRRANPLVVNTLIAIAVASLAVVEMQGAAESEEGFRDSDGLGALLVLAQTLPLALRGVAPLGSLAIIVAAIGLHAALGYDQIQTGLFASLFGVGSAAYLTDNRRAPVALLLAAVGIGVFYTTTRVPLDDYGYIATSAVWLAGWIIGSSFRIRRRRAAAVERRAEVLEQDSEARAREAVADERARITRELHDIIGHTLNLIVVQAGAARAVFKSRPDQAPESLDSIETTARQSLSDMERMLGIRRKPRRRRTVRSQVWSKSIALPSSSPTRACRWR